MICQNYMDMGDMDRLEFNTKLLHCAQHSGYYWLCAQAMIKEAEKEGLFDNVKIGREISKPPTNNENEK